MTKKTFQARVNTLGQSQLSVGAQIILERKVMGMVEIFSGDYDNPNSFGLYVMGQTEWADLLRELGDLPRKFPACAEVCKIEGEHIEFFIPSTVVEI
jgi:hypothetical protein